VTAKGAKLKTGKYTLLVMRHSKAEAAGSVHDFDRELIPTGREKATCVAKKLQELAVAPEFVVTSRAARAFQTAQVVASFIHLPEEKIRDKKSLYMASDLDLLDFVTGKMTSCVHKAKTVLLVGHEPSVSGLASLLADKSTSPALLEQLHLGMSTASVAVFTSDVPFFEWSKHDVKLLDIVTAKA
jgi:phosphohistidine phosphatase